MSQVLTTVTTNLPANIEDLSRFILVGREKLVSVRAEIRAIDKLDLATEVRNQKRDEARMLSEALLDAEVRLGELMMAIPKAPGLRTDLTPADSAVERFTDLEQPSCTGATRSKKSKNDAAQELGFDKNQVYRFETLAANKDIVEQVKSEARENDDIPTRSRVLDLAAQRKKRLGTEQVEEDDYCEYLDFCKKTAVKTSGALHYLCSINEEHLEAWKTLLTNKIIIQDELRNSIDAMPKLIMIQKFLKELSK